jgi:hypothetical protein
MQQLKWNMDLTLEIEGRPHHYSFEAHNVEGGFEVAVQGSVQDATIGSETTAHRPAFYDRQQFPTKADAITYVKDFTSSLVEKSFAPPPIKLNRSL